MNGCAHKHYCFEEYVEKRKHTSYTCFSPECQGLPGAQGNCPTCSYLHGWAQALDRTLIDQWGNWA
jgi:hypothetical protein